MVKYLLLITLLCSCTTKSVYNSFQKEVACELNNYRGTYYSVGWQKRNFLFTDTLQLLINSNNIRAVFTQQTDTNHQIIYFTSISSCKIAEYSLKNIAIDSFLIHYIILKNDSLTDIILVGNKDTAGIKYYIKT